MPPGCTVDSPRGFAGRIRAVRPRFVRSAPGPADLPPPGEQPEAALVGRSNVGKSTLLGALLGRPSLVRTSRTPGATELLNLFEVDLVGPGVGRTTVRVVDLPGYGYAARPRAAAAALAARVRAYLESRAADVLVLLLVDLRRGLGRTDREMLDLLAAHGAKVVPVGTKADKLGRAARGLAVERLASELGIAPGSLMVTSARTGDGIDGLLDLVGEAVAGEAAAVEVVCPEGEGRR